MKNVNIPSANIYIHELNNVETPAFIYDESILTQTITAIKEVVKPLEFKVLFSLKSFAFIDALRQIAPLLDGFSCSSLFETILAHDIVHQNGSVHFTTPSLKADEIDVISELSDYISFNSITQCNRFRESVGARAQCGLRVNPQLSFVEDDRYNPCRIYSKLGVPVNILRPLIDNDQKFTEQINGIHFHTNCESTSLQPLLDTILHIDQSLGKLLERVQWINLGGGYEYNQVDSFEPLYAAAKLLREKYDLEVFIEPGEAIIGHAGYLVSMVLDLFDSDGKSLAILDTTVNHMPQVFEYQYRPDIFNSNLAGKYSYILCGSTCLAGDIFGNFNFDAPLKVGDKIIFGYMGAYTLVKANMFNGINLPNIYALNDKRKFVLKRKYSYNDYVAKWSNMNT